MTNCRLNVAKYLWQFETCLHTHGQSSGNSCVTIHHGPKIESPHTNWADVARLSNEHTHSKCSICIWLRNRSYTYTEIRLFIGTAFLHISILLSTTFATYCTEGFLKSIID